MDPYGCRPNPDFITIPKENEDIKPETLLLGWIYGSQGMFEIAFASQIIYFRLDFEIINFANNSVACLVNLDYKIITSQ